MAGFEFAGLTLDLIQVASCEPADVLISLLRIVNSFQDHACHSWMYLRLDAEARLTLHSLLSQALLESLVNHAFLDGEVPLPLFTGALFVERLQIRADQINVRGAL